MLSSVPSCKTNYSYNVDVEIACGSIPVVFSIQIILYQQQSTVESRFATVRFTTIHTCPVGLSTPDLWFVTVATQASFLYSVRF